MPYDSYIQRMWLLRDLQRRLADEDEDAFAEMYSKGYRPAQPRGYKFGVEAEFFGMSQDDAVAFLNEDGVDAVNNGYTHAVSTSWRVTEDGSVSNEGCELVSPILGYKDGFNETRKAVGTLRRAGAQLNSTCGLHVHHNAAGLQPPQVAEIAAHWAIFQPTINRIVSPSRSYNEYARPLENARRWAQDVLRYGNENGNYSYFGRYQAVNLSSLNVHGTIEFRQHQGTLNGDKIEHWTRLTRAFMNVHRKSSWTSLIDDFGSEDEVARSLGLDGMLRFLKVPGKTRRFWLKREAELTHRTDSEDREAERSVEYEDEYEDEYDDESYDEDPEDEMYPHDVGPSDIPDPYAGNPVADPAWRADMCNCSVCRYYRR